MSEGFPYQGFPAGYKYSDSGQSTAPTPATRMSEQDLDPDRIRAAGAWSEQFSSAGKRYFYNRVTEVSQWEKPLEWIEAERRQEEVKRANEQNAEEGRRERRDSEQANASSPDGMDLEIEEEEEREAELRKIHEEEEKRKKEEEEKAAAEEEERKKKEQEEEEGQLWKKYYNPSVLVENIKTRIFGDDKGDRMMEYTESCIARVGFLYRMQALRAQEIQSTALAHTSTERFNYMGRKATAFHELQNHMEKSRLNFQANFDTELPRLLAELKPDAEDLERIRKKREEEEEGKAPRKEHHRHERREKRTKEDPNRASSSKQGKEKSQSGHRSHSSTTSNAPSRSRPPQPSTHRPLPPTFAHPSSSVIHNLPKPPQPPPL